MIELILAMKRKLVALSNKAVKSGCLITSCDMHYRSCMHAAAAAVVLLLQLQLLYSVVRECCNSNAIAVVESFNLRFLYLVD